jgi:hypothetical protein
MNGKVLLAHSHPMGCLDWFAERKILSYLQLSSSTGPRGTCKKFNSIDDYLNGTIPFTSMVEWAGEDYVPDQLWHLLHNWMGPKWFWSSWNRKFITEKEFRMEEHRDLISY